ncbi:MAG: carbohydrate ABC transporter permease [Spirochaetales bacterium]|nr:carbohydrate ABC transporter permease [Spirochaetales bacterium]
MKSVIAFPRTLAFDNYKEALEEMDFFRVFFNTAFITCLSVMGIVICASMAGYKLSRNKSKLSFFLYLVFVSSMLIPFHSIMISLVNMAKLLKIHNSVWGLPFVYVGIGVNFPIFLYHGFVKSIPVELEDAAKIDGCNEHQTFFKIIFPLLKPINITVAILQIIWIWNDFLLPLLMLTNSKHYTLILSTVMFRGKYYVEWSKILAAVVITCIPVIIIYMLFQRHIVKGITTGAVKG